MNIVAKIKALNFPKGQYVVVASGILEVLNIRDSNDIDIVVTKTLFDKLRKSGEWTEVIKYEKIFLKGDGVDIIPHLDWEKYSTTTEEAIESAYYHEGIAFLNLEELCKFKLALGREKDLNDIKLIRDYQNNLNK